MFLQFQHQAGHDVVTRNIKRAIGFVKQHNTGIINQRTGNGDPLFHPARQGFRCLPAHFGVIAVRHAHDDIIKPKAAGNFDHTFNADVLAKTGDVFNDRPFEHHAMLRQIGNLATNGFRTVVTDFPAIEQDFPLIRT